MSQQAVFSLTAEEEQILRQWARAGTSEHRLVERAKVILLLNQGKANLEIARQLKTRPARVSKWRQRFAKHRLEGLRDADRKGRPSTYDQATDKRVLALLDEPPPEGYGKGSGPLVARALEHVSDDQVWPSYASTTFAWSGAEVGASARTRNSAPKPRILWGCI